MKRPPGLWLLLSAGVLWLSLQDVYGIRATALIFGKGPKTTTTTTTTEATPEETQNSENNKTETDSSKTNNNNKSNSSSTSTNANGTRIVTGIPQIDYITDPNLPRELNGYNLSEYPFYNRVPPEDIPFKCDGLHDGFYASVPHKCQVYHHCLYGTRYDFLCANYTAFDQKTFICQFVSEVDCTNSHKFWHRNDALYQAATTTTAKPPPTTSTTTQPPPAEPTRRRKPLRKSRPHYDYYDDEEYEDYYEPPPPRQRGRRKRPRPRPRPIYEDDYEEYEDDRYERRKIGRRGNGERERRPYDDDEVQYSNKRPVKEKRYEEEDRRVSSNRNEERKVEKRKPLDERNYESPQRNDKRPKEDDYYEDEESNGRTNNRPKKTKYQEEEYTEEELEKPIVKPVSSSSVYSQPRKAPRIRPPVPKNEQNKYNYKPASNLKTKKTDDREEYYYEDEEEEPLKPKTRPKSENANSNSKRTNNGNNKSTTEREEIRETKTSNYGSRSRGGYRKPVHEVEEEEEVKEEQPKPKRPIRYRGNNRTKKRPPVEEADEDELETAKTQNKKSTVHSEVERGTKPSQKRKENEQVSKTTERSVEITNSRKEQAKNQQQSYVRVVKRPFLPSRGGNPYAARGLKPVGAKAMEEIKPQEELRLESKEEEDQEPEQETLNEKKRKEEIADQKEIEQTTHIVIENPIISKSSSHEAQEKPAFKPSPQIIKVEEDSEEPLYADEEYEDEPLNPVSQLPQPEPKEKQTNLGEKYAELPRTTTKSYYAEKSPLDITHDEYDVTLNEAINPTLPNLPIRNYPSAYESTQTFPYAYQRPRTNTQQYKQSYQIRPANQEAIIVPQDNSNLYLTTGTRYNPQLQQETQVYRNQNYRTNHPESTQVRTQPFYY